MTLWAFGDSFTVSTEHLEISNKNRADVGLFGPFQPLEKNWIDIVSEKLTGTVKHYNLAIAGCANEFIFHQLMLNVSNFKSGDYVIVTLTANNRRWLVERCPHLANWSNCKFEPDVEHSVTKAENKAIQQYGRYLDSDKASEAIYNAVFWATVGVAQNVANLGVKFLILPGFHEMPGITGTLSAASFAEFADDDTLNKFYKKTTDNRWNHFTDVNHKILADKVIDFFEDTNHNVDLDSGFVTKIYNKDNI